MADGWVGGLGGCCRRSTKVLAVCPCLHWFHFAVSSVPCRLMCTEMGFHHIAIAVLTRHCHNA